MEGFLIRGKRGRQVVERYEQREVDLYLMEIDGREDDLSYK